MCNINPGDFRVSFKFPLQTRIYGTKELIPFKPLQALALGLLDQGMAEPQLPKHQSINDYLTDLSNNNYTETNPSTFLKNIERELFGIDNPEGHLINHPDHVHFRKTPPIFHHIGPLQEQVSADTPFIFDWSVIYRIYNNSIIMDNDIINKLFESLKAENGNPSLYEEQDLFEVMGYYA